MMRSIVPRIKHRAIPEKDRIKKWKILTGDLVQVVKGPEAGKQGKVIKVIRKRNRVVVEGVNIVRTTPSRPSPLPSLLFFSFGDIPDCSLIVKNLLYLFHKIELSCRFFSLSSAPSSPRAELFSLLLSDFVY